MPIRASVLVMASTAAPSDWPDAKSNPMVAAGNCATRDTRSGASLTVNVATVPSGTDVPLLVGT